MLSAAKHLRPKFETLRFPVERGETALRATDCKAIRLSLISCPRGAQQANFTLNKIAPFPCQEERYRLFLIPNALRANARRPAGQASYELSTFT